jgi:hypothetical protein
MEIFKILIVAIICIFVVWIRIKSLKRMKEQREDMKNLSPELFRQKEATMSPKDYILWLRRFYTSVGAYALEYKMRGRSVSPEMFNALVLMEQEIENINKRAETPIRMGKKMSEEIGESKRP